MSHKPEQRNNIIHTSSVTSLYDFVKQPNMITFATLPNKIFVPKMLSTNSYILPKPTYILPQNINVPLLHQNIKGNENKVRKIPTFKKKPLVPTTLLRREFRCSFCSAVFFGRKDQHEQNCNKKNFQSQSQLMSLPTSFTEQKSTAEFNHPISDDPYIPTILDPTYCPVEEPKIEFVISEKTAENRIEAKSIPIDQQEIVQNEALNLQIPTSESLGKQVQSVNPIIIDINEEEMDVAINENHDQEEPLNFIIGENNNEDLELIIDEDFSSDVMSEDNQNYINIKVNESNICLHVPLKKRGKFSCINCSF